MHRNLHRHLAVQFHGNRVIAKLLDGVDKHNLLAVDGEALRGQRVRDVFVGYRSKKLVSVAGFLGKAERYLAKQRSQFLGLANRHGLAPQPGFALLGNDLLV